MKESVEARAAEMDVINLSLIVQILEFFHKLNNLQVCFLQLGTCDVSLYKDLDSTDKLAEVLPVF